MSSPLTSFEAVRLSQREPTMPHSRANAAALRVELGDLLWERGFCRTYRATRLDTGEACMLTALDSHAPERHRTQFWQGAMAMLALGHRPDILAVYELSPSENAYVAAAYDIGSCADICALGLSRERALQLVKRVGAALGAVHAVNSVHGCLCPDNVLLDDDLNPVLSEVGLVDVGGGLNGDRANRHGYGPFAAPEVRGGETASVRSDVYSFGRFLEYVVFGPEHATERKQRRRRENVDAFDEALERLVDQATHRFPTRRFRSIEELLTVLDEIIEARRTGQFSLAPPLPSGVNVTGRSLLPNRAPEARESRTPGARPSLAPSTEAANAARGRGRLLAGLLALGVLAASASWLWL